MSLTPLSLSPPPYVLQLTADAAKLVGELRLTFLKMVQLLRECQAVHHSQEEFVATYAEPPDAPRKRSRAVKAAKLVEEVEKRKMLEEGVDVAKKGTAAVYFAASQPQGPDGTLLLSSYALRYVESNPASNVRDRDSRSLWPDFSYVLKARSTLVLSDFWAPPLPMGTDPFSLRWFDDPLASDEAWQASSQEPSGSNINNSKSNSNSNNAWTSNNSNSNASPTRLSSLLPPLKDGRKDIATGETQGSRRSTALSSRRDFALRQGPSSALRQGPDSRFKTPSSPFHPSHFHSPEVLAEMHDADIFLSRNVLGRRRLGLVGDQESSLPPTLLEGVPGADARQWHAVAELLYGSAADFANRKTLSKARENAASRLAMAYRRLGLNGRTGVRVLLKQDGAARVMQYHWRARAKVESRIRVLLLKNGITRGAYRREQESERGRTERERLGEKRRHALTTALERYPGYIRTVTMVQVWFRVRLARLRVKQLRLSKLDFTLKVLQQEIINAICFYLSSMTTADDYDGSALEAAAVRWQRNIRRWEKQSELVWAEFQRMGQKGILPLAHMVGANEQIGALRLECERKMASLQAQRRALPPNALPDFYRLLSAISHGKGVERTLADCLKSYGYVDAETAGRTQKEVDSQWRAELEEAEGAHRAECTRLEREAREKSASRTAARRSTVSSLGGLRPRLPSMAHEERRQSEDTEGGELPLTVRSDSRRSSSGRRRSSLHLGGANLFYAEGEEEGEEERLDVGFEDPELQADADAGAAERGSDNDPSASLVPLPAPTDPPTSPGASASAAANENGGAGAGAMRTTLASRAARLSSPGISSQRLRNVRGKRPGEVERLTRASLEHLGHPMRYMERSMDSLDAAEAGKQRVPFQFGEAVVHLQVLQQAVAERTAAAAKLAFLQGASALTVSLQEDTSWAGQLLIGMEGQLKKKQLLLQAEEAAKPSVAQLVEMCTAVEEGRGGRNVLWELLDECSEKWLPRQLLERVHQTRLEWARDINDLVPQLPPAQELATQHAALVAEAEEVNGRLQTLKMLEHALGKLRWNELQRERVHASGRLVVLLRLKRPLKAARRRAAENEGGLEIVQRLRQRSLVPPTRVTLKCAYTAPGSRRGTGKGPGRAALYSDFAAQLRNDLGAYLDFEPERLVIENEDLAAAFAQKLAEQTPGLGEQSCFVTYLVVESTDERIGGPRELIQAIMTATAASDFRMACVSEALSVSPGLLAAELYSREVPTVADMNKAYEPVLAEQKRRLRLGTPHGARADAADADMQDIPTISESVTAPSVSMSASALTAGSAVEVKTAYFRAMGRERVLRELDRACPRGSENVRAYF
ncbi:hypothetical protein T492DRAFT_844806 [Pavlovales sp. CCMP2436]|nr:hypothetical protein T492DRAFT_844806 [Pavlovales sp. CCMP2436]